MTLKKYNQYNFFYGTAIRTFFKARKLGLKVSMAQSKIVAGIGISAISLAFTAGGVYAYLYITETEPSAVVRKDVVKEKEIEKKGAEIKTAKPAAVKPARSKEKYDRAVTRLGINTISSTKKDSKIAADITAKIYRKIRAAKGPNRVVYSKKSISKKSVNRQFSGRLTKLGSTYILAVSVINNESSISIIESTVKYKNKSEIDSKVDEIAELIIGKKEIWERVK